MVLLYRIAYPYIVLFQSSRIVAAKEVAPGVPAYKNCVCRWSLPSTPSHLTHSNTDKHFNAELRCCLYHCTAPLSHLDDH